ncbi:MAG: arsenic resistance N-acetyltransferase ArsN2 [Candidatus Atabeyarchaeum deiterrae]
MELRKATSRDLPRIERLLKGNELPFEDIRSKMDFIFLARVNAEDVGIGGVEIRGKCGLLRSVVVEKPHRGEGYGRMLCDKLVEYAKTQGVGELYLLTMTAERFFLKMGFRRINRDNVPMDIQNTTEFSELCPVSSVCMRKIVSSGNFERATIAGKNR